MASTRRAAGFTLTELLTVIAIVAILSAILFPIFNGVKKQSRAANCMSNMREVWSALKQYRLDERAYPDHIVYLGVDENGNNTMTGLYPRYIRDRAVLTCPESSNTATTPVGVAGTTDPLYPFSSYDMGWVRGAFELHYRKTWTTNQSDPNYRRQLMFRDPPEDTVVTWCTYHRSNPDAINPNDNDLVLWLDGRSAKRPSADPATQWTVR